LRVSRIVPTSGSQLERSRWLGRATFFLAATATFGIAALAATPAPASRRERRVISPEGASPVKFPVIADGRAMPPTPRSTLSQVRIDVNDPFQ
jgi:hypothetical protein